MKIILFSSVNPSQSMKAIIQHTIKINIATYYISHPNFNIPNYQRNQHTGCESQDRHHKTAWVILIKASSTHTMPIWRGKGGYIKISSVGKNVGSCFVLLISYITYCQAISENCAMVLKQRLTKDIS